MSEMTAQAASDALEAALVVLALGLVLRAVALRLLAGAAATPGRVRRLATSAVTALRPGIVRRAGAAVLGVSAALLTAVAPARAATGSGTVTAAVDARLALSPTQEPIQGSAPRTSTTHAAVVVVAGDTLWDIARRHLPPGASDADVAHAWPQWYVANRTLIGPDPDRLLPGMRLRVPGGRPTGTSASSSLPAGHVAATSLDPDRR